MDLGMTLTLIVIAVILLGAALYVFSNIENIKTGKEQLKKVTNKNLEKAEKVKNTEN